MEEAVLELPKQIVTEWPLILIIGPSGSGKTTLVCRLLAEHKHIQEVASYTTREPRPGEAVGADYHFVSREEFQNLLLAGKMAEWVEYNGNFYGASRQHLSQTLLKGPAVIICDGHGATQFKEAYEGQVVDFFLAPPHDPKVLEERLKGRGDSEEVIARRMASLSNELWYMGEAEHIIYPGTPDDMYRQLQNMLFYWL